MSYLTKSVKQKAALQNYGQWQDGAFIGKAASGWAGSQQHRGRGSTGVFRLMC